MLEVDIYTQIWATLTDKGKEVLNQYYSDWADWQIPEFHTTDYINQTDGKVRFSLYHFMELFGSYTNNHHDFFNSVLTIQIPTVMQEGEYPF